MHQTQTENGDYYEAHQLYTTVYFRFVGSKQYGDAVAVLVNGASELFKYNQHNSAAELAITMLEVYTKSHAAVNKVCFVCLFCILFFIIND